jgi:hypothetical protein
MADQPTFPGSTYAGLAAGKYISAALLSAPTIENGGVTVLENVKGKSVLQTIDTSSIFTDATCDFDDTQTVTMGESVLTVKDMQVNLQLCRSQFHDTFSAIEMGASAFADIPKSFEDYLLGYVASKVAASNETLLWTGVAGANAYDGLVTLGAAQIAAGQQIAAVASTAANVIDEMGKVIDAIPTTVYGAEDLKLYVSSNIARNYVRALGGFAAAGLGANGTDNKGTQWYTNGQLSFDGIPVFVANGLADNSMVAAQTSNLYFGTSLLSDWQNSAAVIPVHLYDGSDNVRVVMRMTAGAQIGIANDCVVYS